MKYLTLFTLTLFAAVCAAQSPGPAAPRAADTRIDVGGRKLLLNCSGEMAAVGGPTVILESGMGNDSSVWSKVQPEVAKVARVCSYDRAGLGKSDTVLDERSIVALAEDLRGCEVLQKSGYRHGRIDGSGKPQSFQAALVGRSEYFVLNFANLSGPRSYVPRLEI